jgi:VanZ family protein
MAAIFVASGIPELGPLPADVSDKTAHLLAYAVLGALVLRAISGARWSGCTPWAAAAAWAVAIVYGLTDEWHQMYVPGRTPSISDLVADAAGAALGVMAVVVLARARSVRGREV